MQPAPARPLRHLRGPATLSLFAALFLAFAPVLQAHATHLPVEAPRRTYGKGMPDGRWFGFRDGYMDGWVLTYRRNYNNRVPNRVHLVVHPDTPPHGRPQDLVIHREMPQVVPGPRYIEGYGRAYEEGYNRGYGAGRRDGRNADRSDVVEMRARLACRLDRSRC